MVTAMIRRVLPPFLAALLAAGCASKPAAVAERPAAVTPQMQFALGSGTYRCEHGARVDVQRDTPLPGMLGLVWKGGSYRMQRNDSSSGLPRFEDAESGLVWIDLPWKSVLLDGRSGRPLVSECRGPGSAPNRL